MDFAKDKGPVGTGFSWQQDGKRFFFELDDTQGNMKELFQLTASQCMYEAKFQKSSKDAPDDELEQFVKYVHDR